MSECPRTPAENGELALLLEVAGTPKPGNVDRHRDLDDLRFEQFLAGSVGSAAGLRDAADGAPLGEAFERAVRGMSRQSGGNTQFGCLLLLTPLVSAAGVGELTREAVRERCRATTVDDAAAFYRAFEHVDVAVGDPPECADALDARRGSDAVPALRERGTTLWDVMELSADPDGGTPDTNAAEWVEGFPRTFDAAEAILADDGPVLDRAARSFLRQLATEPDTLVATTHGESVAESVRERAASTLAAVERTGSLDPAEELAEAFVAEGINPGTTADRVAGALFVALERGLEV
ncbi:MULTISPECIES: triphosphoribosyl-dephospho-CoA synthase [Halolamina]|uniref:Triphosphoribosyl-dephospho-CoA synthase n=1 Tax=Halolamina pelagica TaxID=699431 RepID=A0A1I5V4Y0_9EURY|nr:MULTISPECIES: triphosphoribosyl-dephospho-CoA synthase [Halolamina]NHX37894.1 triphosphoribosyl-dephospho-CoA synthase [Halolamina sp. R1-12]SFQ02510.1 triphosphoribosyl-dephospho-CoA synthase [Halolamina pelagica]